MEENILEKAYIYIRVKSYYFISLVMKKNLL